PRAACPSAAVCRSPASGETGRSARSRAWRGACARLVPAITLVATRAPRRPPTPRRRIATPETLRRASPGVGATTPALDDRATTSTRAPEARPSLRGPPSLRTTGRYGPQEVRPTPDPVGPRGQRDILPPFLPLMDSSLA